MPRLRITHCATRITSAGSTLAFPYNGHCATLIPPKCSFVSARLAWVYLSRVARGTSPFALRRLSFRHPFSGNCGVPLLPCTPFFLTLHVSMAPKRLARSSQAGGSLLNASDEGPSLLEVFEGSRRPASTARSDLDSTRDCYGILDSVELTLPRPSNRITNRQGLMNELGCTKVCFSSSSISHFFGRFTTSLTSSGWHRPRPKPFPIFDESSYPAVCLVVSPGGY